MTTDFHHADGERLMWVVRPQAQTVTQSTGEQITLPAGITEYWYNAFGQRTMKHSHSSGQTQRFLWGPDGTLMGEAAPGSTALTTVYVWLGGMPVGLIRNNQLYFIHTDHLGRPSFVSDASRNRVWQAENTAFDRRVVQDQIGGLNLGFPGQYYDAETGTWYNYFRNYDGNLGRYVQSDPIGLAGGLSTYAYGGNPVNLIDPLGLRALTDCEKDALRPYIPEVDLNNADIHEDGKMPWFAPDSALAITLENNIYFREGAYDPSTVGGIALLGHELVHVGQYRNGATRASFVWSYRRGYENSKYEKAAFKMQDRIRSDLSKSGFGGCGCQK